MKQPKILFLVVIIALLPLLLVSCSILGGASVSGGWAGTTFRDGIIYVGTRDGRVVAINASTGSQNWSYPIDPPAAIYTTPIVAGDLVYIGTYSGQVYALTIAQGTDRWVYPRTGSMGGIVGRPVVANETIYVSSSDGRVYALDTTFGDFKWTWPPLAEKPLAEKLWTSPAVVGNALYISTFDGYIYSLSTETGASLNWSFKSVAGFASSPVVDGDTIYVGSFDRHLYAIEIGSNASVWMFPQGKPAGNWFWASPVVSEGVVYAGCLDGRLYAINATTGQELWSYLTTDQNGKPSPIVSSPVSMDGLLIVTNESGNIYVFDLSTDLGDEAVLLKTIPIGAAVTVRSSFCAHDGQVYIRDENNQLYVVDIDKGKIVDGWPVPLD
jgi:outer membrane protein assembly factor BamB